MPSNKKVLLFATLFTAITSFTANANQNHAALTPIQNMFDAMREHDGDKLLAQFVDGALLERAQHDNSIKQSNLERFASFVNKSDKYLDEHLFNITLRVSDNLASAWTPYAFYLDGKLSHCGVNSFQMVQYEGTWKIRYLIDNQHQGDCLQFIAQHKKASSEY